MLVFLCGCKQCIYSKTGQYQFWLYDLSFPAFLFILVMIGTSVACKVHYSF